MRLLVSGSLKGITTEAREDRQEINSTLQELLDEEHRDTTVCQVVLFPEWSHHAE